MTYCLAIRVDEGLVFASDSRTNAGADQISTYSKMDRFGGGRERTLTLLSSGNLATCQGVVTRIKRDIRSSARVNLMNVEDLQAAAEYVGSASPHFSPGAVMIAEDFGPVYCVHGAKRPARASARSAGGRGQRSPPSARSSTSRSN